MRYTRLSATLLLIFILSVSCSSIPKGERLAAVNAKKEQAALFLSRGHNEYGWSNFESSGNLYHNAFVLSSSIDWEEGMIRSLVHMSRSVDNTADSEVSKSYLNAAEELLQASDNQALTILVGNRAGEWLLFHGTPEQALDHSKGVIRELGSEKGPEVGETWRLKASVHKKMKDYDDALEAINKAIMIDDKYHYIAELASDYYIKASILSLMGSEDKSISSMLKALHYDKFIENTPGIAQDLYALALIYEKNGKTDKANHYFQRTYLVYQGAERSKIPSALEEKLKNSDKSLILFEDKDVF